MNFLRSIVNWIASFESGSQFRKWVSILLKILGLLTLIGAIVWGIMILIGSIAARNFMGTGPQTLAVIGSILVLCINLIVGAVLTMLFWNRANKIRALGEESHLTLIPIAVILIRLFGEVGFLSLVGIGIQGLVSSIFGSGFPGILAFFLSDQWMNVSFIIGVISLVTSVLSGAILLITHYFIAELINLFVDMATNLRKIETTLSTEEVTSDSTEETTSNS